MDAFEAVSLPEPSFAAGQRYFSVAEANRALVLVRRIVADIVRDYRQLCAYKDAYQAYDEKGNIVLAEQTRQDYVNLFNHLSALRDELEEIGCELKDYELGLVDFPTMLEGREVLLCWKLGEDSIEYWHEVDAGYSGRRRIADMT
jgi:hypothetical protein